MQPGSFLRKKKMRYGREYIETILHHRAPMLLVDTVEALEPGKMAETTFYADPEMEIFRGHFPGDPVLPGVYTIEVMGQAADVLVLSTEKYAGKTPLFLGLNGARFYRKIVPGETVCVHVEIVSEREDKAIITCAATASVGGEKAASCELAIAMR